MDSGYEGYESSWLFSPRPGPVSVPEVTIGDKHTIDFKKLPKLKDLSPS
jgi:hypothetical protein